MSPTPQNIRSVAVDSCVEPTRLSLSTAGRAYSVPPATSTSVRKRSPEQPAVIAENINACYGSSCRSCALLGWEGSGVKLRLTLGFRLFKSFNTITVCSKHENKQSRAGTWPLESPEPHKLNSSVHLRTFPLALYAVVPVGVLLRDRLILASRCVPHHQKNQQQHRGSHTAQSGPHHHHTFTGPWSYPQQTHRRCFAFSKRHSLHADARLYSFI